MIESFIGDLRIMEWILTHLSSVLGILLLMSEIMAAITQMFFPENKGITGFLASMIKLLQELGAEPPST